MDKCLSCQGTLRTGETECFLCGTPVPPKNPGVPLRERLRKVLSVAFVISAALTAASLFTSYTPSFVKCLVTTVILFLVKSSMDQMVDNR